MACISLRQFPHHAAARDYVGAAVEEIMRGGKHGVHEVNTGTGCRLATTAEFRRVATTDPDEFDPREFSKQAMERVRDLRRSGFEQFSTAGQAGKIKVQPMSAMARRSASGAFDPRSRTKNAAES